MNINRRRPLRSTAIGAAAPKRPKVLISASATGYYGNRGNDMITEASKPGKGFLPDICVEWETAAPRPLATRHR